MTGDDSKPEPTSEPDGVSSEDVGESDGRDAAVAPMTPAATTASMDPDALKDAHGRTGRMLQNAGLPFEEDEFDEADDDSTSASSDDSSSSGSSSSEEE